MGTFDNLMPEEIEEVVETMSLDMEYQCRTDFYNSPEFLAGKR